MGLKTREEYIESLRALHPTAYMFGERITNIVDTPACGQVSRRRGRLMR